MLPISDIIKRLADTHGQADLDLVQRAYDFSVSVHKGQKHPTGESFLSHLTAVADILVTMNLEPVSVAAGLLHDALEDGRTTGDKVRSQFGSSVYRIVSGVTRISTLPLHSSHQASQAENIRKMILAMADDIRVILIKLADRLDNMRTIEHLAPETRLAMSQETLDIYSPIAARLGIYWIKNELDIIAFQHVHPNVYQGIANRVKKDRVQRDRYVVTVKELILKTLSENNIPCEVMGRYKNFYSIYTKMISQDLPFEEIYDIIAFRVIVDTIPQCYEVLGHLHAMWKPIAKKFKDYIGFPKSNMYQSLHTTVIGPNGERVEIQIRTWEMDEIAKSGIAAHWSYKEGNSADQQITRQFGWIQNLVENQDSVQEPGEFLENVRIDLFPDEVYVFTPNGEIKTLPKGATPVDFAYTIHSEVGHQCTGAKVNGRMVPLQHKLATGDILEIITTKGHEPSKDWLNYVKTVKARSRIRQWIKIQDRERSLSLGREMCEKLFRKHRLNFNVLVKSKRIEEVSAIFGFKDVKELIASVGYGKITPLQIIRKLEVKEEPEERSDAVLEKFIERAQKKKEKSGVLVRGLGDILIRFGQCCRPVPGDPITGYITQGHGVTIHRTTCVNALKMNPERRVDVSWNTGEADTYPVKINVQAEDRVGLLADIASTISKQGANILSADSEVHESKSVYQSFTITVKDTAQLKTVMAAIRRVKPVRSVRRVKT
ncbi:MAG: bifunctional (p)ppGpp synthetase/guanosine-3',5'-bis(diphosphate) 3'-pyrophosphohydrolase [Deltaproteobacteria bacterium]|nr:bifunctional (p)ppGpp synthetase/guanosine-3',5'-bis(diphosphate) 3'-pyrophosphohydrolase [Deltaproteobacteria bacterium]